MKLVRTIKFTLLTAVIAVASAAIFSSHFSLIGNAQPPNTFSGVLTTDNTTSPLPGVTIDLVSTDNAANDTSTVTGSDGSFSVAVTPDTYTVTLSYTAGTPIFSGGPSDFNIVSTEPFNLTSASISQDLEVTMSQVNITVDDAGNNSISGATIATDGESGTNGTPLVSGENYPTTITDVINGATTGSHGNISITVPTGTKYGQTQGVTNTVDNIVATLPNSQTAYLSAPLTVTGSPSVTLTAPPIFYNFSGNLTDQNSDAMTGVTIDLTSTDNSSNDTSGVTGSGGSFSIPVVPDTYTVTLSYTAGTPIFTGGPSDFKIVSSDPFNLSSGNLVQNLQVNMSPLTVNVEDSGGNPINGATVATDGESGTNGTPLVSGQNYPTTITDVINDATTGSDGSVSLVVPTGTDYGQTAGANVATNNIEATVPGGSQLFLSSPLTVTGSSSVTLQEPLVPIFSGVLTTDNTTSPLPGVTIDLVSTDNAANDTSTVTGSDGSFSVAVTPDTYTVTLSYTAGTPIFSGGPSDFNIVSTEPFNLTSASISQDLEVTMSQVNITVDDAGNNSISGATIAADGESGTNGTPLVSGENYPTTITDVINGATTGSHGNISITVPTGTKYGQTQGVTNTVDNIVATLPNSQTAYLSAPLTVTGSPSVTLTAPPIFYNFSGNLTDQNSDAMTGVTIDLTSTDNSSNDTSGVTGSGGSFSIPVVPDTYTVTLSYTAGTPIFTGGPSDFKIVSSDPFNLSSGNLVQNLQVNMSPLTVNVEDSGGNPINGATVATDGESGTNGTPLVSGQNYPTTITDVINDATTGSDGSVSLVVPTGTDYGQTAGANVATNNIEATVPGGSQLFLSSPLTVTGSSSVTLQEPLVPIFSGVLTTDNTTSPLPGVTIDLVSTDNAANDTSTVTGSDGSFSVAVTPDTYTVTLSYTAGTPIFSGGPSDFNIVSTEPFNLTSASISQDLEVTMSQVNITVDDAGNNSISGATIATDGESGTNGTPLVSGENYPTTITDVINGATTGSHGNISITVPTGTKYGQTQGVTNTVDNIVATLPNSQTAYLSAPLTVTGSPSVTLTAPPITPGAPTGLTINSPTNTPVLNWTGSANATSYNIYRDGVKIGSSTTTSYTDSTATNGTYSYYVTAVDVSVEGSASNTVSGVLVDKTAPTITYMVSPAANSNGWNATSVIVTFTCSEPGTGVSISSCTSPVTLSSNGANQTVKGTAVDAVGNTNSVTTSAINIDNTTPTVGTPVLTTSPITAGNTTTLTASAKGTTNLSPIVGGEYYIGTTDPGQGQGTPMTYSSGTGNLTATVGSGLSQGSYTINVRAENAAGTWSTVSTTTLVVNSAVTAPGAPKGLTIHSPTNTPVLNWTGSTNATSYNIYRNGAKIGSSTTTTYTDSTATNGTYSYYVTALDQTVESGPSNTVSGVVVDKTAPTITYTVSPAANSNGWNTTAVTVTFTCSEPGTGVSISSCTSPVKLSSNGSGQTAKGTAVDAAGNTNSVTTSAINIDNTVPTVGTPALTSGTITAGNTATLTVSAKGTTGLSPITGGEYYIGTTDPGKGKGTPMTYSSVTGNLTATVGSGLTPGTYKISVRSENAAGTWSTVSTTSLVVKAAPPTITSANQYTVGVRQIITPAMFTFTTTGTATVKLTESGKLPSGLTFADNGNGTANFEGMVTAGTAGTYKISITASNSAGSVTQSFTLTITNAYSAPTTITSNTGSTTLAAPYEKIALFVLTTTGYSNNLSMSVSSGSLPPGVYFLDNGNGTAEILGIPLKKGTYTFTVKAQDSLGSTTQQFTLVVS